MNPTEAPYTSSMTHKLTVAAAHTPFGEPIRSELHDEKCTTCKPAPRMAKHSVQTDLLGLVSDTHRADAGQLTFQDVIA